MRKAPGHIDIKPLPKRQTSDRERRKRCLFVAIKRCSRSVHLAVAPKRAAFAAEDDETERSAIAFLHQAASAFPFRLTHVPTDNGSGFTPAFAQAWHEPRRATPPHPAPHAPDPRHGRALQPPHRQRGARPHHPLPSRHEQGLRGFNTAYKARRQRVLDGRTPNRVVAERLHADPKLANPAPHGRVGPCDATRARLIVDAAKEASQPNS